MRVYAGSIYRYKIYILILILSLCLGRVAAMKGLCNKIASRRPCSDERKEFLQQAYY